MFYFYKVYKNPMVYIILEEWYTTYKVKAEITLYYLFLWCPFMSLVSLRQTKIGGYPA